MLPPRRPFSKRPGDSELHKKFIRGYECVCYGNPHNPCDITHKIECAHVRSAANSGMGKKPGAEWIIPLCRFHHAEQHQIGQVAFENKYGFNMAEKALEFSSISPDREIRQRASDHLLAKTVRRALEA